MAELMEPYRRELTGQMNEIIGQAPAALPRRKPESPLGNWIADALQDRARQLSPLPVHASIQNYGGIRIPELPAGDITVGRIYELMPFDNTLVIVELSAELTQRLFDQIAADGGWPVSQEVYFTIREQTAQDLRIQGQELQAAMTYYIAMPDYIANGGGDCAFLRELPRQETGVLIRDILIDHVRQLSADAQTVQAANSGRIVRAD
jgi:2',3'-cyclic-nucleotide 2'-phosphodiesterase (5'-nucleotidase family)